MKKCELIDATKIACESSRPLQEFETEAVAALQGLVVELEHRYATLNQVAWFIRYQCCQLNGRLNMKEYNDLAPLLLKRVTVVGP